MKSRGDWHSHPAEMRSIFDGDAYAIWDNMIAKVYESNRILPQTTGNPEWN